MDNIAVEILKVAKELVGGATNFQEFGRGSNAKAIFKKLVEDARDQSGSGGYSGTIGEKNGYGFKIVGRAKTIEEAWEIENEKLDRTDKWGPAFAVEVAKPKGYLFFGMAST